MKQFVFFFIALSFVVFGSCNSKKKMSVMDNSKTSLDWEGTYLGTLPCADCVGIKTQLTLKNDLSYILKSQYIDKSDTVFIETGQFKWNKTGSSIALENKTSFKVGENILFQLDKNGNQITGDLAEKYTLKKEFPKLTGKYWSLTNLNGNSLPATNREAFIQFDKEEGVVGNSSCNSFRGSYKINENKISFTPFAMTKMACIGNNVEQEFMNALGLATNVSYSVNELILLDDSGKQLAIFEADYFK